MMLTLEGEREQVSHVLSDAVNTEFAALDSPPVMARYTVQVPSVEAFVGSMVLTDFLRRKKIQFTFPIIRGKKNKKGGRVKDVHLSILLHSKTEIRTCKWSNHRSQVPTSSSITISWLSLSYGQGISAAQYKPEGQTIHATMHSIM